MLSKAAVPLLASLALFASAAVAQEAPQAPQPGPGPMMRMHMDPAMMAKHRAQFCQDRYARAVGKLAYLETSLDLTDVQKPLFNRWKNIRLEQAKAHSEQCATVKLPGPDASIMDRFNLRTTMLEARLADRKAETPALEALVKSLTPDQVKTLERAAMMERHHRMEMMHRWGDRMGHGRHIFATRTKDGAAPPPPPAQ